MFRHGAWILLWLGIGCAHMPPPPPTPAQTISATNPLLLTNNRPLQVLMTNLPPQPTCLEILASLPRGFQGRIELFLQMPPQWEEPRGLQPDSVFTQTENSASTGATKVSWTHCLSSIPSGIPSSITLLFRLITTGKSNYVFIEKLGWSESSMSSKPENSAQPGPS